MNNKAIIYIFNLSAILILLAGCASIQPIESAPAPTETPTTSTHTIVLGDISDDPAEVIEGTQPLADYLASQLSDFGIDAGKVIIAKDADEMSELLASGEVDIYFDSIYPATLVSDASGGQVILRRWRYGVEEYQSVIFATKESGINSIEDLHGHMLAFDNQFSTSGFVLPAMTLHTQGIDLVGKEDYNAAVGANEAGFVFSFDDENTLQWILSGFVDAAATDDYYYEHIFSDEVRANLVELGRTDFVPRQVVVVSPTLEPELLDALTEALTTAHETEAGAAALEPFQTSKFDRFPEGIEAASASMREMLEVINTIPLP